MGLSHKSNWKLERNFAEKWPLGIVQDKIHRPITMLEIGLRSIALSVTKHTILYVVCFFVTEE